ncbi:MAG: BrnT family toxin [Spirochaetales bacterium]|nr:BrnT family toxin [Spirochaetales bacterium]
MRVEWDEKKNIVNQKKHGVSFEEARTVFFDEEGILIPDPDHSETEERFVIIGRSIQFRILIVCHCYRENDEVIRLISARKANSLERNQYINRR